MTDTNESVEFPPEIVERLTQKGLLFEQLLQSEKFTQFFALNYDIIRNEDAQTIFLVEVPPEEVEKRVKTVMKAQAKQAPKIVPATELDLKKWKNT